MLLRQLRLYNDLAHIEKLPKDYRAFYRETLLEDGRLLTDKEIKVMMSPCLFNFLEEN